MDCINFFQSSYLLRNDTPGPINNSMPSMFRTEYEKLNSFSDKASLNNFVLPDKDIAIMRNNICRSLQNLVETYISREHSPVILSTIIASELETKLFRKFGW